VCDATVAATLTMGLRQIRTEPGPRLPSRSSSMSVAERVANKSKSSRIHSYSLTEEMHGSD